MLEKETFSISAICSLPSATTFGGYVYRFSLLTILLASLSYSSIYPFSISYFPIGLFLSFYIYTHTRIFFTNRPCNERRPPAQCEQREQREGAAAAAAPVPHTLVKNGASAEREGRKEGRNNPRVPIVFVRGLPYVYFSSTKNDHIARVAIV